MTGIKHHLNLTSRNIGHHFKKHHKKYVFGLISGALLYKTLSLILANVFLNNFGTHQSFADNTEIPTNPEVEYVEENNSNDNSSGENLYYQNNEEENNLSGDSGTENSTPEQEDPEPTNEIDPEVCSLGDIELLSPLSGDILKGEIEISWIYKNKICEDIPLIIKLRDANTQYIKIGEANEGETGLNFDSSLLYSGYYNITGLNLSGEVIITHTGEYTGLNTKYFSGHKIVIYSFDMEVLCEGEKFTIDNEAPSLSNVEVNTDTISGNYIGLGKKVSISFGASEELSGVSVTILGVNADLEEKENNNYEYISYLSEQHTSGNIIYNIEFGDLAGNTGYHEGYSNIIFDKDYPEVTKLEFSKTGDNIKLILNTDKSTSLEFVYVLSGNNTGYSINSSFGTSHNMLLENIRTGSYYNYSVAIKSLANNVLYIGGYFRISGDNVSYDFQNISGSNMLVGVGFMPKTINSGSVLDSLLIEIDKFNSCKQGIPKFTNINIPIGLYHTQIKMPELEKSYVKKLVSAFSIVLFERIEDAGLNKEIVEKITEEFNDFLVILKLVQDDDNQCEQSLSNYYMSRFKNNLIKYNLADE